MMMSEQATNDNLATEAIALSLQQISNVLAHLAINMDTNKDKKQVELVKLLLGLGYERSQIASILDTTIASVTARMADLRKAEDNGTN
jgi:hypothetical protein